MLDGDGLQLRIYPSGKRVWQFRYRFGEYRRVMPLGSFEHVSLKDARELATAARGLLDKHICPIAHAQEEAEAKRQAEEAKRQAEEAKRQAEEEERRARARIRTTGQIIQDWLELEISHARKDGGAEIRRMVAKDVLPYIGHKELKQITKADMLDIIDRVKLRGSRIQANHVFSDMRQFFNWCLRRELIDKSPMYGLSKIKDAGGKQEERQRFLSDDEIILLRDKLPAANLERTSELAVWLMLSTMCRVGELLKARWEHIDFTASTWRIPAENAKNGYALTINLSSFAKRHFEELHALTGWSAWVYPSLQYKDKPVNDKTITRQVADRQRDTPFSGRTKATDSLILPGGKWTPHDLRRTGSTIMKRLRVDSDVIDRCQNHVEEKDMKRVYQVYDMAEEKAEAWRKLGDFLDRLIYERESKVIHANFAKSA